MQTKLTEKDSRESLDDLLVPSSHAVFIYDFKKIVDVNEAFLQLFGYKYPKDVVGSPAIDTLVFEEDVEIIYRLKDVIKEGVPSFIPTIRLVKQDGTLFIAEAHLSLVEIKGNRYLQVYCRDITESRNAEIRLQESGKKYRALFENSLDGIYKSTPEGKFVDVNPALVEMLGYSSTEELLAIDIKTQLYLKIEDRKIMAAHEEDQYPLKRKDGSIIWVEDRSYYEYDAKGIIAFHHGIIRDVTGKLERQKEKESLLEVTEDQNRRLQDFAYIISHNIRSHSSNLSALVHFMEENEGEEDKTRFFEMLKTSTAKLEETIQNLNQIITVNQSLTRPQESRNLKREVENTLKILSGDILRTNTTVSINIDPDLEISVIPAYLDSILLNVISNAVKYHAPDRDSLVDITANANGCYWVVSVEDNGLGIDLKKNSNKLFRMYEKLHYSKDSHGFGLYITKNQIEAMGGKIEVQSEEGKGSVFHIFFRREEAQR